MNHLHTDQAQDLDPSLFKSRIADLTLDDHGAIAWFEDGGMSRIDNDVLAKLLDDLAVRRQAAAAVVAQREAARA